MSLLPWIACTKFQLLTSPSFAKMHILSILFLPTRRDPRKFPASTAVAVLAFPSSYLKVPINSWIHMGKQYLDNAPFKLCLVETRDYDLGWRTDFIVESYNWRQDEEVALWLAIREGKMALSVLPAVSRKKNFIDQTCSVKMAGCCLCSFFLCEFMEQFHKRSLIWIDHL